ncbi:MAG: hypothetical protein ACTHOE_03685, partial [Conexibacter sp.]
PARRADARGRSYVRAQVSPRFGALPTSVRDVTAATVGTVADHVFLVAAADGVCLVSSARLEIGCDVRDGAGAAVTAHTVICSPYLPNGVAEVYGSVPDAAARLRMRLRDGRSVPISVEANVYRYYWPKHARALPHVLEWHAAGTRRAVEVPLPSGRGWLDCGASAHGLARGGAHGW